MSNDGPPNRRRDWIPRLAVESVVVVLSILLALGVDEWRDRRESELRVQRSLRSIRSEVERNRQRLRDVAEYHVTLADTLRALAANGVADVGADVYPRGWLLTPELVSGAWRAANATGTTAEMPLEIVLDLSETYEQQAQYRARRESIIPMLYGSLLDDGGASFAARYTSMAAIIHDVGDWEASLLRRYERALARLDESSPE